MTEEDTLNKLKVCIYQVDCIDCPYYIPEDAEVNCEDADCANVIKDYLRLVRQMNDEEIKQYIVKYIYREN